MEPIDMNYKNIVIDFVLQKTGIVCFTMNSPCFSFQGVFEVCSQVPVLVVTSSAWFNTPLSSLICFKNFIQSHITEILNISIRSFKWGGGRGRKKIWMSVANRPKHWRIKDTSVIAVPSRVTSF